MNPSLSHSLLLLYLQPLTFTDIPQGEPPTSISFSHPSIPPSLITNIQNQVPTTRESKKPVMMTDIKAKPKPEMTAGKAIKDNPLVPIISLSEISHLSQIEALETCFGMRVDFGSKDWMNPKSLEPLPDNYRK